MFKFNRFLILFLVITILCFLIADKYLVKYGRGIGFFSDKIPLELNIDFDKYDGFILEEAGFIQVIGKKTKINSNNSSILVRSIQAYSIASDKEVLLKVFDTNNIEHFIKVILDSNSSKGKNRKYVIAETKAPIAFNVKDWITVDDSNKNISFLVLFRHLMTILFISVCLTLLVRRTKRKKKIKK